MADRRSWTLTAAALCGGLAVVAGAFAVHGLGDRDGKELLRTGSNYEAIHALAAVIACLAADRLGRMAKWAAWLFLTGSALFSGSLFALALGAPRPVGLLTPLGGLAFIAGWLLLAFAARRMPDKNC